MPDSRIAQPLNDPKIVRAWYMYDWANSVYSLVITTAIFPIYYKSVTTVNGSDMVSFLGFSIQNSVLYSYALSFSFLLVSLMLPILSGTADYTGRKKVFMKCFVWMGGLSCMGLFFFDDISMLGWGIFCSILASVGYASSLVFYDAFLPEIVTEDRYDITSARGFSMGYYGSVLLMVICTIIIIKYDFFYFSSEAMASRFSFLLVGVWWIGFSFIPFSILPDNIYNRKPTGNIFTNGYLELKKVWGQLTFLPDLKRYLWAFFFYNMGVQTVMYLATLFGTDVLHMDTNNLIAIVVIIQLVGAVGAYLFARLSNAKGNRFSLMTMIIIWIGICLMAYFIETSFQFYILAMVVGMVMGGIQSLSRATYSKLLPANSSEHASFFSFYDVTYNVSIVLGTFTYGFINQITGSMRYSALALGLFFVIGLVLLMFLKSPASQKQR
jgi:UMF1 family MFS transporter